MERSDFEYSLLHLHVLRNQIAGGDEAILFLDKTLPLNDVRVNFAVAMIWQLLIVHVQSYREEILRYSLPQFKMDKKQVLVESVEFCDSLIETDWPDLRDFRNQVIAHGYRDWQKESLFKNKQIDQYKTPKEGKDFTRLTATIRVLHDCVRKEYAEYFEKFNLVTEPFFEYVEKKPPL